MEHPEARTECREVVAVGRETWSRILISTARHLPPFPNLPAVLHSGLPQPAQSALDLGLLLPALSDPITYPMRTEQCARTPSPAKQVTTVLFIGSPLGARNFRDDLTLNPPKQRHEEDIIIPILQIRKPRLRDKANVKAQVKNAFFIHAFNAH